MNTKIASFAAVALTAAPRRRLSVCSGHRAVADSNNQRRRDSRQRPRRPDDRQPEDPVHDAGSPLERLRRVRPRAKSQKNPKRKTQSAIHKVHQARSGARAMTTKIIFAAVALTFALVSHNVH